MAREKFPGEHVEQLKSLARIEETAVEAEDCQACAARREETGDATFLCEEHLRRIYGAGQLSSSSSSPRSRR